jgi:hypothetical protein
MDDTGHVVSLDTVTNAFICWGDYLVHRQRVAKDLHERGVYQLAKSVAAMLDAVLDRRVGVLADTRIRKPRSDRPGHATKADKQNLEQSFAFGHLLVDICNALTVEAMRGPLPVRISLRNGKSLEDWSFLPSAEAVDSVVQESSRRRRAPISQQARAAWAADTSLRTRYPLVNLRIEAELLLFIAQTGLNRAQAHTARMGHFHYTSRIRRKPARLGKRRTHHAAPRPGVGLPPMTRNSFSPAARFMLRTHGRTSFGHVG